MVTTEFLEHVEEDLSVIGKVRSGAHFIGTVPNFPYISHVRHFDNVDQVNERYGSCFCDLRIVEIFGVQPDSKFYLMDGTKI